MTASLLRGSPVPGRAPHADISIGVPWVLVLVHAVALIVSSMVGLAVALFL